MTSQMRLIAIVGGVAFVVAAAVAFWFTMAGDRLDQPGWPPSERAAFVRSCVEECRNAPGVTPDHYPICDRACTCAADEGEKIMTVSDMSSTAMAVAKGTASTEQTAKMDRIKAAGMRCAAGSTPAQK